MLVIIGIPMAIIGLFSFFALVTSAAFALEYLKVLYQGLTMQLICCDKPNHKAVHIIVTIFKGISLLALYASLFFVAKLFAGYSEPYWFFIMYAIVIGATVSLTWILYVYTKHLEKVNDSIVFFNVLSKLSVDEKRDLLEYLYNKNNKD